MKATYLRLLSVVTIVLIIPSLGLSAGSLWITEVNPSTGEVEVTNCGTTTFTLPGDYPFSHKLDTSTVVSSGTTFGSGESKIFVVSGLDSTDSDLWLYSDTNFANPASMLSGLKYGPAAGVGEVAVAVAASLWPSTTAYTPATTSPADSIRLIAYDPALPDNWSIGAPTPGQFFGTGTKILNPIPSLIPKGTIRVVLSVVASGLVSPIGIAAPDNSTTRLFVYDQSGTVHIIDNGVLQPTPFLDVSSRLVPLGLFPPLNYDERGLLGFATHPNFASNAKVYTYTSELVSTSTADFTTSAPVAGFDHQDVIAEWTVDSGNPNLIDPSTRRELIRVNHPQFNHDGGTLRFGPDGMLYFSLGDGGAGDDQGEGHDPDGNAQNTNKIFGKILRIDVDGNNSANGQYGIPADNPFVLGGGLPEIWAYGLRNPYAFSFDQVTGDLYVGDAGQNFVEEVDLVVKGGNYGWRLKEGSFFFDPSTSSAAGFVTTLPVKPVPPDVIDPVWEYDHNDGIVVVGGVVYRGSAIPELAGRYVTGDFSSSFVVAGGRLFYADGPGVLKEFILGASDAPLGLYLKGFGQDQQGEIYVCASSTLGPFGTSGVVLKLVAPTAATNWQLFD